MKRTIVVILFCFFAIPSFAWNSIGHQLVAQIALDQLTPTQQIYWQNKIAELNAVYPHENFVKASTLPDELKKHGINAFNTWHFIDLPVFQHHQRFHYFIFPENIIWALNQSIAVEKSHQANSFEKAFFASFLIHLVGDAHQPLHCASLYNAHFPHGDQGGNLYKINNRYWHNLHAYWDYGGGFLSKRVSIKSMAKKLEAKYPPHYFEQRLNDKNFKHWIQEGRDIAEKTVYAIAENTKPSNAYQQTTQQITQEQIVLAGYRLAQLLSMYTLR